ncbi:MAG: hypothetical protein ACRC80_39465, partial [Waterburya sp.]
MPIKPVVDQAEAGEEARLVLEGAVRDVTEGNARSPSELDQQIQRATALAVKAAGTIGLSYKEATDLLLTAASSTKLTAEGQLAVLDSITNLTKKRAEFEKTSVDLARQQLGLLQAQGKLTQEQVSFEQTRLGRRDLRIQEAQVETDLIALQSSPQANSPTNEFSEREQALVNRLTAVREQIKAVDTEARKLLLQDVLSKSARTASETQANIKLLQSTLTELANTPAPGSSVVQANVSAEETINRQIVAQEQLNRVTKQANLIQGLIKTDEFDLFPPEKQTELRNQLKGLLSEKINLGVDLSKAGSDLNRLAQEEQKQRQDQVNLEIQADQAVAIADKLNNENVQTEIAALKAKFAREE